ncbi:MAG: D-aminoacyl-tRNA deacylase [Candidatus Nanoarchaeia archaeon]
MKLIAVSKSNIASQNIGSFLEPFEDVMLKFFHQGVLEFDFLENFIPKPELLVIPSSHSSTAGKPMLSVHATGNWGEAKLGGKPRKLSIAPALWIARILQELADAAKENNLKYEVGLEVTHHGPTIEIPVLFVEIGSSQKEWSDLEACGIIANCIKKVLKEGVNGMQKENICFGFGGPHYAPNFTKRVLSGKFVVGHICPKYHINNLDESLFIQAYEKTTPKPNFAVLDWKGLKADERNKLLTLLKKYKISWEKI